MNALTPLAIANSDVLRALATPVVPASISAMAREIQRDPSNLHKTIKSLQGAGLLCTGLAVPSLTDAGKAALAAIERAEDPTNAVRGAPEGYVSLRHDQIRQDPFNARTTFDEAELLGLAETLFSHGLQQAPQVTPADVTGMHQLVAGERRWRAWGILIKDGRWPADHVELCRIESADELARLEAGLIENLQRVDLNHMEAGIGFERLAQRLGRSNKEIAAAVGKTPEYVQQHRRLSHLSKDQQAQVRSGELRFQEALRVLAQPKPKPMPDEHRLVLAEVVHALRADNPDFRMGRRIKVQESAKGDARLEPLERAYAVSLDFRDFNDGFTYLRSHYYVSHVIEKEFPDLKDDPGALKGVIEALRSTVLGDIEAAIVRAEGRYATEWLNGPFVLSAEAAAEIAARKERRAEEKASDDAAKAKAAAARAAIKTIDRELRKVVNRPLSTALVTALAGTGAKLPLQFKNGNIADAAGKTIATTNYYNDVRDRDSALRLLMVAANAATGFVKAKDAEEDDPDPERDRDEAAVDEMAVALKAKLAEARAKGRRGWHDANLCSIEDLARDLLIQVQKGDPIDIAAFATFLWKRGGDIFTQRNLACVYDAKFSAITTDVCELPDRTSPDGWPDACLVTPEELYDILTRHFAPDLMQAQATLLEARSQTEED
jgi:ParB/RepB/Spo0J family partition protein